MKGLLIKDYKLMKNQKQFWGTISLLAIVFLVIYKNPAFVISYITILFSIFTISTITYDEYDNGGAYLFTLPISRKGYVGEKYIFGLLSMIFSMASILLIAYVSVLMKHTEYTAEEWICSVIGSLVVVIWMLAVTIPLQFKFGAEKSRIALMAAVASTFLLAFGFLKLCEFLHIDWEAWIERMIHANLMEIIVNLGIVCTVGTLISFFISVKIMQKKQF